MPYIGRDLNRGNYLKLDDISSSFNGSTQTFNLTVGGSAFTPGSAFSILVSVGGVIQEPESAYQVNNSEITFANAPTAQDGFFCIALAVPIGIGVPGNGTVNGTQVAKPFNYDGFFYLDDANNRVGIGSLAPTVALDVDGVIKASSFTGGSGGINAGVVTCTGLDVNGNGDISGNLVLGGDLTVNGTTTTLDTNLIGVDRIEVGANSSTVVGVAITQSGTADILRLYDGTSQVVTVDDEGKVGIGTNNPSQKLDVNGKIKVFGSDGSAYGLIIDPDSTGGTYETLIAKGNGDLRLQAGAASYQAGAANILLKNGTDNIIINAGNSGNVGIGTDNPLQKLHIADNTSANIYIETKNGTTGSTAGIYYKTSSSTASQFFKTGIVLEDDNSSHARGKLHILQNNTADGSNATLSDSVVTFAQDGKVGIGSVIPAEKLDVAGNIKFGTVQGTNTNASLNVLFQTAAGVIDGGSALTYNPSQDVLSVNGNHISSQTFRGDGNLGTLTCDNYSSSTAVAVSNTIDITTVDNAADAFTLKQGSNEYITVDTTNSSELITLGNTTTNPNVIILGGNVGIGSVTPGSLLNLASNNPVIRLTDTDSNVYSAIGGESGFLYLYTNSTARDFIFRGTGEVARLTGDGKLGIGTNNPGRPLTITSADPRIRLQDSDSGGHSEIYTDNSNHLYLTADSSASAGGSRIVFQTDGANERARIDNSGNLTVTGSTHNLFTSNSYNVFELRADENNDGGNDDIIFKFTHDGTFRSEMRYDESSSTLEISTADNRDDFSMDTDGKVTFAKDIATAQDYPMVKPTLDCNFVLNKKLDPRIGFTRKGVASFYDEKGTLKIVGDNVPRFDHNPETRESLGILIEEQRTNLQPHSEQWSPNQSDGWINVASGVDVDYDPEVVTPTGETTGAITFMEAGASGQHYIAPDTFPATSGTAYTFSFFFKNISGNDANNLKFISSTSAFSYVIRTFYFSGSDIGTTNSPSDSTITKLPNGWWRGTVTLTANNTTNSSCHFDMARGLGSGAAYNNKIALWGYQVEAGAFPTSYIRTGNSDYGRTATRGVDFLQIQGQAFTDLYNPVESTILCSYQHTKTQTGSSIGGGRVYRFGTGSTSSDTRIDFVSTNTFHPYIARDNSQVASLTATAPSITDVNTYATRVKQDDFATTKAGGSIASDTTGDWDPFNKMTEVQIGGTLNNTGGTIQAHYKRFTYYPVGLPNSQLITISS